MYEQELTVDGVINGEKIKAETYETRENPAHPKQTAGFSPVNTEEDAVRAIDAADDAFLDWTNRPVNDRIQRMRKAIQKIKDTTPAIKELLSREHGKPLYDAEGEIGVSLAWMEFACDNVEDVLKSEVNEDENGRTIIARDGIGVVSAISPWNYPLSLSTIKIAPALLAGNTMVLKPSPYAPLAVTKVTEMIAEEMPDGVLNLVHGDADVGKELTSNPKVAKIAFTGGTETAKHIMKAAADTIKNMTLELGGNDAAVVLSDFDVNDERAMRRMVISNFLTAGQICMIAKRIYVDRSIYDQFVKKYKEAADQWIRVGDPVDENVTIGPINNKQQVDHVQNLLDQAENNGAEVIKLGTILDEDVFHEGYFMQPTMVLGVDHEDPIVEKEQFGPTVPILPFDGDEHGIELANSSIYGLTSSVWGEEEHAVKVARRIQAGTTMINTAAVQGLDVRYPFGGVKQSGIGREYGEEGLLAYTDTHVINIPNNGDLPYIPE
ncbi:aldehyde dehydrogenase family protein [Salibacterium lacus]|uniref:Aldehyde dehydrogenase family protein n=1 Tax=Salibacterium lacus TaxID=1898109 RepID=A0ABW5T5Q1_9BACI